MSSHSSNPSPMPFPFLPVVLDAPKAAPARGTPSSPDAADVSRHASAGRGKPRNSRRGGVAQAAQPPGMDAAAREALRIEVVRSVSPECLTVLGAIVR
ncbi:hypothetical protein PCA20602_00347 [Pandoraea capi]|uniref:Uncharacterized protein n=1 Tax=Pandoraea capi TaxID=2508286 RepID=A0ABY6VML4_9BURK|nr:hypothetical protein PCA20602_00347 [Pandoraea capi]